jgi:hypothetical protein
MDSATQQSQVIFRISSSEIKSDISLKPEAWRILTQANGVRSIAEIARHLGTDEAATFRIADSLFQANILEVAPGSVAAPSVTVGNAFFKQVVYELTSRWTTRSIIIEDEIAARRKERQFST